MVFSVNAELGRLPPDEREGVVQKIELVQAAQRRLGMEPRDDSRLTFNYASGQLDDDEGLLPSTVANELVIIDRIHRETRYADVLEDAMRAVAYHVKEKYSLDWTTTWDIVRFYVPTMLKLHFIKAA